jgi:hypothetical protein
MRAVFSAFALATLTAGLSYPAWAKSETTYPSEDRAKLTCGLDADPEVVWVDLDKGVFYHKSQAAYGKGGHGGYACITTAKKNYHEAKS